MSARAKRDRERDGLSHRLVGLRPVGIGTRWAYEGVNESEIRRQVRAQSEIGTEGGKIHSM